MKTETKKKFVIMAVDRNDCSDEILKKLKECDSREEAVEYIREDMRGYCDNYTFVDKETGKTVGPKVYDEDKFYIESDGGEASCQWSIVEVDG